MRELLIKYRGKRTQKEMAEKYGVSQQSWAFWELGKSTPKPHIMKKIALDNNVTAKIKIVGLTDSAKEDFNKLLAKEEGKNDNRQDG